jgi:hypothetical protein
MSDQRSEHRYDPFNDTQQLLLGVEAPEEGAYRLEDILAEFGESAQEPAPSQDEEPTQEVPDHAVIPFPAPAAQPESAPEPPAEPEPAPKPEPVPEPEPEKPAEEPVSLEDVVASTVDSVRQEQEQRQDKLRKKRLRLAHRREKVQPKKLPQVESEPSLRESANFHKRRYQSCRASLVLSLPLLALLWLPWLLEGLGYSVPFFSKSIGNTAVYLLILQAALCVACWSVFKDASESFRRRTADFCTLAALSATVSLLDEITLLFLPSRAQVSPMGSVSALAVVMALWGMKGYHKGMWDALRTAAMGEPGAVVDRCEAGDVKGQGSRVGFYTRCNMPDVSAQTQRLLFPILSVGSLVFAVLASVGRGRGEDVLWCWSVILCACTSLAFPLSYRVPFGRLSSRLASHGAAVAGQYGAGDLAASKSLVVTDTDLFPQGTVSIAGLKLYGEERVRAVSYAATLAVQGGGCLGKAFSDLCRSEQVGYQSLEHFHVHDDAGLSGMIDGETVLFGTPVFMRHKAVRLPNTLPSKTCVCLAVDGTLTAIFAVKYAASPTVTAALKAVGRNGMQLTLATRDGNITPKLLKARFGLDAPAKLPDISQRLALSDPERESGGPDGLLYREGLYPFVELASGSRRLCQLSRLGNLLSVLGSLAGALLGFYLTFTGSYAVLTPSALLTYLALWTLPLLPLLWGVDKT